MALFDAYADRVPIYLVLGNTNDAAESRRRGVLGAQRAGSGALVRDMTKWDDNPVSLAHFAESARARVQDRDDAADGAGRSSSSTITCRTSRCPHDLRVPKRHGADAAGGRLGRRGEAAKLLVAAENPVTHRRSGGSDAGGLKLMVELAETLQAGVVDRAIG